MREYLLKLRKRNRLSENDIAEKLNITEKYYRMIESGLRQKRMDITLIINLANIFNISTEEIISEEEHILIDSNIHFFISKY